MAATLGMAAACGNISLSSPRLVSLTSHTWTPHLHLLLGMVQVSDKINKDILGLTRLTLRLGRWNFFLQLFLLLGFGLIRRENLSAFGRDCFLDVLISSFDLDIKIQAANHILKIRHPSSTILASLSLTLLDFFFKMPLLLQQCCWFGTATLLNCLLVAWGPQTISSFLLLPLPF